VCASLRRQVGNETSEGTTSSLPPIEQPTQPATESIYLYHSYGIFGICTSSIHPPTDFNHPYAFLNTPPSPTPPPLSAGFTKMSLPVAIQSVLYYILSCSTCNKVIHRRKAKVQAQRDRAEKSKIEDEQPGLYRHPSPFRTNPYWDEEIALGPNPARKKTGKDCKTESTKALNGTATGNGSSITSSGAISLSGGSPTNTTTEGSRISGEGWNRKLYQRENEPLWGFDTPGPGQRIKDAIARAGSTAGRLFEGKLTSKDDSEDSEDEQKPDVRNYYVGRNPPVNDLHPPVVTTTPTGPAETSWMLQPPPSAKVMEGKERVGSLRSRADSNGSSRRGGDDIPLSRKVTEKLAASKLRNGGQEFPELRPSSSRRSSRPVTQASVKKQRRSSSTSTDEEDSIVSRRRQKSLSLAIPPPIMPSKAILKGSEMRELPSRPTLGTILSSSTQIPQTQPPSKENKKVLDQTSEITLGSRSASPAARLSPSANSMPATLPSKSKFPGADNFVFPRKEKENQEPMKIA